MPVDPGDVNDFLKLGFTPSNAPPQQGTVAMTPAGPAPSEGSDSYGIGPFQVRSPAPLFNPANWSTAYQNLKAGFQGAPPTAPTNLPEANPALAETPRSMPGTRIPLQQGISEASSLANLAGMFQGRAPGAVTKPIMPAVPESMYYGSPQFSTVLVNGIPTRVPIESLPTGGTRALPVAAEMFRSGVPGLQGVGQAALGAAGAAARVPKAGAKELLGMGPSMQRLEVGLDSNALDAQNYLSNLSQAVKTNAQRILNSALDAMDADNPKGVIDRDVFGGQIRQIYENYVRTP